MRKNFIVVIPARLKSNRLPGKPLIKISGVPMVVRTYLQCAKVVDKKLLYVATDSSKIKSVCEKYGIRTILTSSKCFTGTDRVAEVAKKIDSKVYINVQGDEPIFNPADLKKLIKFSLKNPKEIISGYCKITEERMYNDLNVPKVVLDKNNYLFHAGTLKQDDKIYAVGGRVLNFVSISDDFSSAKEKVISKLEELNWSGGFYRKDIGYKVIK